MKRTPTRFPEARASGLAALVAVLSGCANLSGLSGRSDYACKAPEGVTCQSVSGTYANAVPDSPSGQRVRPTVASAPTTSPPALVTPTTAAGTPLRSAPRILRLWFKPWEDADRDLFDQGHVYVQVDGGRWLVEHAQRAIREGHAPIRAASVRGASEPPPPSSSTPKGPAMHPPLNLPPVPPVPPARPARASPGSSGGDAGTE